MREPRKLIRGVSRRDSGDFFPSAWDGRRSCGLPLACGATTIFFYTRSVMHHHDQTPNAPMQHCLDACTACARICERCADDMIGMDSGGHKELQDLCIRLCQDCADLCALSARWISRMSPSTELLCRACAEMCDRCASVCEQHSSHHPLCGECAVECRRCAAACRDMAAAMA